MPHRSRQRSHQGWPKSLGPRLIPLAISALLLLIGCVVTEDSPAPGCVESVGLPIAGGCFGKTVILDLSVEPNPACLTITANNCNGGVLEVDNACQETLILDGVEVPPATSVSLDIAETAEGKHVLREVQSNFSDYTPDVNTGIIITGKLGPRAITVTFTKTRPLCE